MLMQEIDPGVCVLTNNGAPEVDKDNSGASRPAKCSNKRAVLVGREYGVGMTRVLRTVAMIAIATAGLSAGAHTPVLSQTMNDALSRRVQSSSESKDRLLVEAKELVYDNDKNTIAATGDVELYYQGRTLQAEKVIYDRNTNRVFATGNAKITEKDGTIINGDRFELTDDFKDGFMDSLRTQQSSIHQGAPVTTRFTAPRAERTGGETMVFTQGTYTACEPCKTDPTRPPLWQVKAARIIHNNTERMIYYESARLEFAGIPIAYIPYFSTPDPSVKRKSGFLTPHYIASSSLGTGISMPYFFNLAPNYDVTVTPTYMSRQGLLGQVEWRHRLDHGSYNIRAAGITQRDGTAFLASPVGAANKEQRGSLESAGRFYINQKWQFGWDVALTSDKWFLQNYRVRSESISSTYFKESTSTAFFTGKGDAGFFDLRGYYFRTLSYTDWQKHQPVVLPVLDYNKRLLNPGGIGGEFAFDLNFTSLARDAAQFQQIPKQTNSLFIVPVGNTAYGLYETCTIYQKGNCLVRGIGGSVSRLTTSASWRRNLIDPLGQVWTPFASLRADGFWINPDTTRYQNANILGLADTTSEFIGRAMPAVGVTYKFPFVANMADWGTHIFEPIGQIVARPSESRIGRLPNEDAQSLVFDDTSIFEWNKFSGYDRVEGGVRANVGAQYSITTDSGAYTNFLFGQSFQLAGRNSFARGDLSNTGLDSGLETRRSDYVARAHFAPNKDFSFTARGRFDEKDFDLRRIELTSKANFGPITTNLTYARYAAQPLLGADKRREGVLASAVYRFTPNWYVTGTVLLDLDRYLTDRERYIATNATTLYKGNYVTIGSVALGAGYTDECTTFSINYSTAYKDTISGAKERAQSIMLRLELKTLGQANFRQNFGSTTAQDGISQ
jgi:LPS-assembly protein